MKKKREIVKGKEVFPLVDLTADLLIQVSTYLDVFSLCCLFLTKKWRENPEVANYFEQLSEKWKQQFAPYEELNHELKRLFILSSSDNMDVLKDKIFMFDETKLDTLDKNNNSLIHLIRKKNNPLLKEYLFNQLVNLKKQDPVSLIGWAISLDQACDWLDSMLKKICPPTFVNGRTLLQTAVHFRSINAAKMLLHHGYSPNEPRFLNEPPLYSAISQGDLEMVQLLLECAASTEVTVDGFSPLHIAAQKGYLDIVRTLCHFKADVNCQNPKGATPLYLAMQSGHCDVVVFLLEQGADAQLRYEENYTPLYTAAYNGHFESLQVMLAYYNKRQFLPNERTSEGDTPLYVAAQNGHVECCQILLRYGADMDVLFKNSFTPLYIAVLNGHFKVIEAFAPYNPDYEKKVIDDTTYLYLAAKFGDFECCRVLLKHGAMIDTESCGGYTPMYVAAQNGEVNVMKELAPFEPNYDMVMPNGYTALTAAIQNDHHAAVIFLCLQKVKLDAVDGYGLWPLAIAAVKGNLACLEVLLDAGAMIDNQNQDKGYSTALAFAAQAGQLAAVEYLISRQADVNSRSSNGMTPLHFACERAEPLETHFEIIKTLIKAGANTSLTCKNGKTPAQVATDERIIRLVKKTRLTSTFFAKQQVSKEENSKEKRNEKEHCIVS